MSDYKLEPNYIIKNETGEIASYALRLHVPKENNKLPESQRPKYGNIEIYKNGRRIHEIGLEAKYNSQGNMEVFTIHPEKVNYEELCRYYRFVEPSAKLLLPGESINLYVLKGMVGLLCIRNNKEQYHPLHRSMNDRLDDIVVLNATSGRYYEEETRFRNVLHGISNGYEVSPEVFNPLPTSIFRDIGDLPF